MALFAAILKVEMGRRKQIGKTQDGKPVFAELVDIAEMKEHWNEYTLYDGTTLKLRSVPMEVYRVEGVFDEQGNPQYLVRSQNLISVDAPSELTRGGRSGNDN